MFQMMRITCLDGTKGWCHSINQGGGGGGGGAIS